MPRPKTIPRIVEPIIAPITKPSENGFLYAMLTLIKLPFEGAYTLKEHIQIRISLYLSVQVF